MESKGLKGFILKWLGVEPAQHDTKILVHEAVTQLGIRNGELGIACQLP